MPYPPQQSFADKHGGFVISVTFHLAFLMVLHNVTLSPPARPAEKKPEPIRIELSPVQETAVAEPEPEPRIPEWDENVATVAESETSQDTATPEGVEAESPEAPEEVEIASLPPSALPLNPDPMRYLPEPSPAKLTEPDLLIQEEEPEPPNEAESTSRNEDLVLDARIEAFLREREQKLKEYNDIVGRRGSDRVAQKLSLARAELEGKRWLETTEGGQEGAIRSFSSEGVSPKIAEEVYARYGITSFSQYVDVNRSDGQNYLNSARVGGKQYVRREGRGIFRVLSIPQSAYAHLARLERDALVERGLDPATTRILEVEFGIASVGKTYDLAVSRIRVAPMEFRP